MLAALEPALCNGCNTRRLGFCVMVSAGLGFRAVLCAEVAAEVHRVKVVAPPPREGASVSHILHRFRYQFSDKRIAIDNRV